MTATLLTTRNLKLIAFDADDTLWVNEPMYVNVQQRFRALVVNHVDEEVFSRRFFDTQMRNLKLFGYGAKGFMLSMIETAIELTDGAVTGKEIQQIIDMGKELVSFPIDVLDGVRDVLDMLSKRFDLMVLTKGDLFDQESKIARSGLDQYFKYVEIVSEKNEPTYERIIRRYGLQPNEFLMIGNSLRSDILPVIHIGANAVHVPYSITWAHEQVTKEQLEGKSFVAVERMQDVLTLLGDE